MSVTEVLKTMKLKLTSYCISTCYWLYSFFIL